MLYPENIADKLGFTEIRQQLKGFCLSAMGSEMAEKMRFITQADLLRRLLEQTAEMKDILENDSPFPASDYIDMRPWLNKLRLENAFLSEEEVFHLMLVLKTIFRIIRYLKEREETYPALAVLLGELEAEELLLREIGTIMDEKGQLRPDASPRYGELLQQIHRTGLESRKRLDSIFRQAIKEGWIADGNLTVREGRMVIPVMAEYKRKIQGFVHDESASGQTVFIEPAEVFELNNRLRDLEFEKRREITRILIQLSGQLRPYAALLQDYQVLLTRIDFIRAKALLAIRLKAEMPKLIDRPEIRLVDARHPLLWLSHRESGQEVVPLSIRLDETDRIVVLSGPNAGGKSVCLKTVGLLQLMLQSGLLLPASEFSELGIFSTLLADIGDDQSIESDLSTYSAHLSKMREFIAQAGPRSLVLIDEFGTGTDPQFGGPLAEAVLEALNAKEARGVITTHYSNLKLFAGNTQGLVNASMLFDNEGLRPLYRLEMGKPGSSYAFEIAQKIGLPEAVLRRAREKAGAAQNNLDSLLIQLEREKKELLDRQRELDRKEERLSGLTAENERLKQYFEENRRKILKDAREEALGIISGANKVVENTIREIKQSKAEREKTREARRHLQEAGEQLNRSLEHPAVPGRAEGAKGSSRTRGKATAKEAARPIEPGDWVKIRGSETSGEVLSLSRGSAVLAIGNLRTVAKLNTLEKIPRKQEKQTRSSGYSSFQQAESMQFSPELDLRGMRGEEALAALERVMDRALMLGAPKLRIVHGKGDGILRKLVRNYLQEYPQVSKMEDEHPDRGGDGVTYVFLG